ncbi:MAG: NAD(P)H-nitrite reductase large subunit [Lentimonas sp.]|jgi:NAD(P)H-nitrite reductase large subunit
MKKQNIIVIGNGMVGCKFCARLVEKDIDKQFNVITFCEEPNPANDITIHLEDKVVQMDRANKTVTSAKGIEVAYDKLILGLKTHVVEFFTRLMPRQVDEAGGEILKDIIESRGIEIHLKKATTNILGDKSVTGMAFKDESTLDVDMIVVSAGIRPRDELARECGLEVGEGGMDHLREVIVDDSLGICDELDAQMKHLVDTYHCEWKDAIEDTQKLKLFKHFGNSDAHDPNVKFTRERTQIKPALETELVGV